MSNIIDKLNSSQKEILHLFLLEGKPLVFGVIDFYMDKSTYELAEDINVLQSTSMLDSKSNTYQINSMAKDYLSLIIISRVTILLKKFLKKEVSYLVFYKIFNLKKKHRHFSLRLFW